MKAKTDEQYDVTLINPAAHEPPYIQIKWKTTYHKESTCSIQFNN